MSNAEAPSARAAQRRSSRSQSWRLFMAASALATISLLAAACGGGAPSASKSTTTTTAAATGVSRPGAGGSGGGHGSGSAGIPGGGRGSGGANGSGGGNFGPAAVGTIASISGQTLEVQNPSSGQTTVDLTSKTVITETLASRLSSVITGACISATGTRAAGGMAATSVTIFTSSNGGCNFGAGFNRPAGSAGGFPGAGVRLPRGGSRPRTTVTRPANFASATGKVLSVSGSKITVQAVRLSFSGSTTSTSTGPEAITVGASTKYSKFERTTTGSLKVGECATALGSTNDIGIVTARSLSVSQPTSQGCTGGFAGGGRFFFGGGAGAPRGGGSGGGGPVNGNGGVS
jgi:hypothetical protein